MQRRTFLQNLLFITGAWITGCTKRTGALNSHGRLVTGKVTSQGKGLANVIISDGFSVVNTDREGSYKITLTANSEHIFVSIPSGYVLPHEKNIARHYKEVQQGDKFDFELTPLAIKDDQHQFMIWADPQVKNASDVDKLMTQSVPDVQQYIKALPANTLIHGICVGDIVWDNLPLYSSYNQAIEKCGLPFFQVIGNHDMDYEKGGDEKSDDTFKKTYGPSYYSFNRGQVHYVVLDDVYYLGNDRDYKGFITEDQLAWLQKDLSFVTPDKLIVLCTHIPVHNSVENKQALYDILKPYKAHIMSGHTHYNMNVINGNVYEHVHGTVCGAWWTGPICGDGTPPGYAIYEVNGTDLKWHYKSVGKTKAHQIRTIVEPNSSGDRLVANVWNWDPTWKVEWQVDGTSKGTLTRSTDYDPLAVALYLGDQLPASRTFVEPNRTEHLFKATIPKGAQQVKIIATDRFGNRYEAVA
ncbi:MAG: calcineurin-like phosphoesterase C-terminal domain-containing protein [Segetibacter sp.]|nr:calcineurin-like phosphoesterase C-terminal domain-containing protein [Segetibacter sp.]